MNQEIVKFAKEMVLQRIGLSIEGEIVSGKEPELRLTPSDIHPNESFYVSFLPGWRTAKVVFVPGKFSAQLVSQMGQVVDENRTVFFTLVKALDLHKSKISFKINGMDSSINDNSDWPAIWNKMELKIVSAPQIINSNDKNQMENLVTELVVPMFGMLVALIGAEEITSSVMGDMEGSSYLTLTTRYERKKINREACIQLKGTKCKICGFSFSEHYGDIGKGYIEIHHTTPVSMLGPNYKINITTDLEPLCANCHAMVHRSTPPITVEQLSKMLDDRQEEIEK